MVSSGKRLFSESANSMAFSLSPTIASESAAKDCTSFPFDALKALPAARFASGPFRGGYRLPRKLARSIQLAVIRCSVRLVVKQLRFFARPIRRPADLFRHACVITLQKRKLIQRVADAG